MHLAYVCVVIEWCNGKNSHKLSRQRCLDGCYSRYPTRLGEWVDLSRTLATLIISQTYNIDPSVACDCDIMHHVILEIMIMYNQNDAMEIYE